MSETLFIITGPWLVRMLCLSSRTCSFSALTHLDKHLPKGLLPQANQAILPNFWNPKGHMIVLEVALRSRSLCKSIQIAAFSFGKHDAFSWKNDHSFDFFLSLLIHSFIISLIYEENNIYFPIIFFILSNWET